MVAAQDARSGGRLDTLDGEDVFDGDRDAGQGAGPVLAREAPVGLGSLPAGQILGEPEESTDPLVLATDDFEMLVEQLGGTELPALEPRVQLSDALYGSASWMALTTK